MQKLDDILGNGEIFIRRYVGRDITDGDPEAFYILKNVDTEFMDSVSITEISLVISYEFVLSLLPYHTQYYRVNIRLLRNPKAFEYFYISGMLTDMWHQSCSEVDIRNLCLDHIIKKLLEFGDNHRDEL